VRSTSQWAHAGGGEQSPPFGDRLGRLREPNHAQEIERVAVEHQLHVPATPRRPLRQPVEPDLELLIVEEVFARDGPPHRIDALTQVQIAHHDDAIGQRAHGCARGSPGVRSCNGPSLDL
jgi:hypothetical protein